MHAGGGAEHPPRRRFQVLNEMKDVSGDLERHAESRPDVEK